MAPKSMRTLEEVAEAVRYALPPTTDDVPVTIDGRRIDTREKVFAWLAEMDTVRSADEDAADA